MTDVVSALNTALTQLTSEASPWQVEQTAFQDIKYHYYPKAPKTLPELLAQGRAHGDNEFLIYADERLSFNDFFAKADALAWHLQNTLAIQAGDRVAIAMRNYPEWMIAFVAMATIGAVIVPLNSWGQKEELLYGLKDSGSVLAFFDQQRFDYIADELHSLNIQAVVARAEKGHPSAKNMHDLYQAKGAYTAPELDSETLAMIMYTAGTTGEPKGVMFRHRNLCQAIYNFELSAIASAMCNGDVITKMFERGFPSKTLLAVPLFHVSGCHSVFLLSLRGGRSIYIMHKWETEKALQLIEKERITTIYAVPTMLVDLLEHPHFAQYDTQSLFAFGAGGSAQPPHLAQTIAQLIKDSLPGTGYGMTETCATGFSSTGAVYNYKPNSCGTATPIVEARITDEQGVSVAANQTGEIWLKSPSVAQGYWNKPTETAATFQQGWVKTGDIGYLDTEGFLYITDRIKDMVIRGGENITCIEIENAAINHADIKEAAAFGLPHASLGEELALALVIKADSDLNEEKVQAHIAAQLAAFKVPSRVFFVAALPRNATQKVIKSVLKKQYT